MQALTLTHCVSCLKRLPVSRPKLDYVSDLSVMSLLSVSNIQQQSAPPRRTALHRCQWIFNLRKTLPRLVEICVTGLCKFEHFVKTLGRCHRIASHHTDPVGHLWPREPGLVCLLFSDWWNLQPNQATVYSLLGRPASGTLLTSGNSNIKKNEHQLRLVAMESWGSLHWALSPTAGTSWKLRVVIFNCSALITGPVNSSQVKW